MNGFVNERSTPLIAFRLVQCGSYKKHNQQREGRATVTNDPTVDPAKIALDLWTRLTPTGEGCQWLSLRPRPRMTSNRSMASVCIPRVETQCLPQRKKAVGANKTVGLDNQIVSASLLAPSVILAHILSSAEVPQGPLAGKIQFRFTVVIVKQNDAWKLRSSSTTLVQLPPS